VSQAKRDGARGGLVGLLESLRRSDYSGEMESAFIEWLRQRQSSYPAIELGIGDDAAVIRVTPGSRVVVTTDTLTDGVDFHLLRDELRLEPSFGERQGIAAATPAQAGFKALAVNLSDLAAMAARPLAAFISLVLPHEGAAEIARGILEGMAPLAEKHQLAIAGGDTNIWTQGLVIGVTAIGETELIRLSPGSVDHGVWQRSGAQPGDRIIVTGEFGGSLLKRHLVPQPRIKEARYLARNYLVHAATDVSDGLSLDLSHIAEASGCGAQVELDAIPIAADAMVPLPGSPPNRSPMARALSDGEDFELIMAVPPREAERMLRDSATGVRLTCIGEFVAGSGLWARGAMFPESLLDRGPRNRSDLEGARGSWRPLSPAGFRHT